MLAVIEEVSPPIERSDWRGRGGRKGREGDTLAFVPPHRLLFPSSFVEALASVLLPCLCPFWRVLPNPRQHCYKETRLLPSTCSLALADSCTRDGNTFPNQPLAPPSLWQLSPPGNRSQPVRGIMGRSGSAPGMQVHFWLLHRQTLCGTQPLLGEIPPTGSN